MAVVEVRETNRREGTINATWLRTYKREFIVITDEATDGPLAVREGVSVAFGIAPNTFYFNCDQTIWRAGDAGFTAANATETDAQSFVSEIAVRGGATEDGLQWTVTVTYAPYDITLANANPIDNRLEIVWSYAKDQIALDVDANGNAVLNAAGDPFDPPIMRDRSRPILTIARNELLFDPSVASFYIDKTNADLFYGYPPDYAKMANISASQQYHPTIGYYARVNYEVEFNVSDVGWQVNALNQGYRVLKSGSLVHATLKGIPVQDPVLLAADGTQLPVGGTPVFLPFQRYEQVPFGPLNLGG